VRFQVEPFITDADQHVREASASPDNTRIAYRRGRGDIMVMDIGTRESTCVIPGWDPAIDFRWSPDGKFIAYSQDDQDNNRDVWIIPADASAPPKNITRHPDNDGAPRWSADGKMMAFVSERNNNESDVFVVMLDKSLEGLQSAEREKYFKDAADAARKRKVPPVRDWSLPKPAEPEGEKPAAEGAADAPADAKAGDKPADAKADDKPADAKADDKPADAQADDTPADAKADDKPADAKADEPKSPWDPSWSLDDAYLRVRRVTSLLGPEGDLEMLPSGENVIFGANGSSGQGLYNSKWDGSGQRKISARVSVRGLNFAGDQIVGVSGGKACLVPVNGTGGSNDGPGRTIDVDATIRVDLAKVYEQKFLEAMRLLGENFYHPTMKGLDWNEITQRYLELARRARTSSEFDSIANRALGELNASHMGIRSPGGSSPLAQSQGRLGVRTENMPEGLKVTFIMPESPAAIARNPLRIGDIITHVDEVPVGEGTTLDSMMTGTTGRETWLTITRTFDDGRTASFDVSFEPTSSGTIGALAYSATRRRAAELVDEWSGGRIGYIHIQGMNQPSLDEFERDLFAAAHGKDGLVIDVRNNGGGWTADRLLASIMAQRHAYTVPRGADPSHTDGYPQDRLFIQRFSMPINMLCNEKSFSNAEIVSHAFKTLKRGTLVGMPTYGGVISTGSASLLDGTTVRMPTRGWFLLDGTDMENNGAVPDIIVPQTPEAEAASRDDQLKAAVEDLMKRLPAKG
jgi:C-terminal processing protease CtpA/Prc